MILFNSLENFNSRGFMQISRKNNPLSNALAWLELTYSNIRMNTFVVFAVIGLGIAILCAGAYHEAAQQASAFMGLSSQPESLITQVIHLVNQYGLGVLVAICYFSNATHGGKRRELVVDAICIVLGVLLPQLVYHSTWLYVTQDIINTYLTAVSTQVVNAINLEWMITVGLSFLLIAVAFWTWRSAALHGAADGNNRDLTRKSAR
jgi:hypothetical protein